MSNLSDESASAIPVYRQVVEQIRFWSGAAGCGLASACHRSGHSQTIPAPTGTPW
ncbi:hypothetical protein ACLQ28_18040 [Micromonospora sp. DT201]|uniref:hypothetical protein n=1 Tax=Micromonospora sp. DT201 TaxID=3393442 RepID=UPI003CE7E732